MTSQKIAIGLVAVALFAGVVMANAADFSVGYEAYLRGDYSTALRVFRQLADQGEASAQNILGIMYANGLGVTQDNVQAYMWLNLAAAQGAKGIGEFRDLLALKPAGLNFSLARKDLKCAPIQPVMRVDTTTQYPKGAHFK